jgi:hypothetical protein
MEIGLHEKRKSPRKPIHASGELIDVVSGGTSTIELLDISVGGISFLGGTPLLKDSLWLVHFHVGTTMVRGIVRIAYCVKHSLTDAFRLGAEFRGWNDAPMMAVRKYLDE